MPKVGFLDAWFPCIMQTDFSFFYVQFNIYERISLMFSIFKNIWRTIFWWFKLKSVINHIKGQILSDKIDVIELLIEEMCMSNLDYTLFSYWQTNLKLWNIKLIIYLNTSQNIYINKMRCKCLLFLDLIFHK